MDSDSERMTVPYFAELAPECPIIVEALARGAIRRDYDQGQVVLLEGEGLPGAVPSPGRLAQIGQDVPCQER